MGENHNIEIAYFERRLEECSRSDVEDVERALQEETARVEDLRKTIQQLQSQEDQHLREINSLKEKIKAKNTKVKSRRVRSQ